MSRCVASTWAGSIQASAAAAGVGRRGSGRVRHGGCLGRQSRRAGAWAEQASWLAGARVSKGSTAAASTERNEKALTKEVDAGGGLAGVDCRLRHVPNVPARRTQGGARHLGTAGCLCRRRCLPHRHKPYVAGATQQSARAAAGLRVGGDPCPLLAIAVDQSFLTRHRAGHLACHLALPCRAAPATAGSGCTCACRRRRRLRLVQSPGLRQRQQSAGGCSIQAGTHEERRAISTGGKVGARHMLPGGRILCVKWELQVVGRPAWAVPVGQSATEVPTQP